MKRLRKKRQVLLVLEDSGGGIHPQVMEKIFDPYFTTKEQGKGTGTGLFMAKTIIESHMGGTLEAQNGKWGARFVIALPEVDGEKTAEK